MERKKKKIKILYTIPNFNTAGSGKALLNIATRLNSNIFEPHIACFNNKGVFFKTVQRSNIPIYIYQFTYSMKYRILGLYKCFQIAKWMRKLNIDIIHSFHYAPDYSEVLSARLAGIPWVFTKKNMNWGGKSKNGWRFRSALSKHIIIQNIDMQKEFYPFSDKITLIQRGVDLVEFNLKVHRNLLLQSLGLPYESKIIIVVANLVPVKGVENLIYGFNYLDNKNYYLLIVGDDNNDYAEELKNIASNSILMSKIKFLGKRNDINCLLKIARVFVLPTLNKGRKEGSPVALLEAMASGVPVLASNISGSSDILNDMPELLYNPSKINTLVLKLEWLLTMNEIDRKSIISRQLEIINKNHTLNLEVNKHENVYLECLNP